jgi:hypothetical protein
MQSTYQMNNTFFQYRHTERLGKSNTLFLILLFSFPCYSFAQIDTLKITKWPSSYEAYFNAINDSNDSTTHREPSNEILYLKVRRIEVKKTSTYPLVFVGESLSKNKITVSFAEFDTTKHTVSYESDKPIDGKTSYGHDGISPGFFSQLRNSPWEGFRYQYLKDVRIDFNGKIYSDSPVDRAFYFNCPSSDVYVYVYETLDKKTMIVGISSGDGAGTYQSLLFYQNGKYHSDYEWQYGYDWYLNRFGKDYFDCKDKKGCIYNFKFR